MDNVAPRLENLLAYRVRQLEGAGEVPKVRLSMVASERGLVGTDSRTGRLVVSDKITSRYGLVNGRAPYKLLIYYGFPSALNGIPSLDGIAQALSEYDVVVLGGGLQEPAHPDHANVVQIISKVHALSPSTLIFGYIDLGVSTFNYSIPEMQGYTDNWKITGADGIFWDDAGYDFLTPRARQTAMILYARSKGMPSFMNSFNPDDIFGDTAGPYNPTGASTVLGQNDLFLLESLPYNTNAPGYVANSGWLDRATLISRVNVAQGWRSQYGTRIAGVSVVDYSAFDNAQKQYLRYLCQAISFVFSLDFYGDSADGFSAFGPNANVVYKGAWDEDMGKVGSNAGPTTYDQQLGTTLNRYDYKTRVHYVDGTLWAYETPKSSSPLFPQPNATSEPPAGLVGRIAYGPAGTYRYDNGVAWTPI